MSEYIIENLTKREIDIMESSDIEWCPDDMSGDNTDIVVFDENDYDIDIGRLYDEEYALESQSNLVQRRIYFGNEFKSFLYDCHLYHNNLIYTYYLPF